MHNFQTPLEYKSNSIYKDFIVILSILMVIDFWSFLPFLEGNLGALDFLLHSFLLVIYFFVFLFGQRTMRSDSTRIDFIVKWTIISVFIGIIPSYIYFSQPALESIRACLRLTHGLFLYFVLRKWNYSPQKLMTYITIVSVVWVILEIGQQFTYPDFWFSGRYYIFEFIEVRMNIYRYYIWGVDFVMISYAYWMCKMLIGGESYLVKANVLTSLVIALILMAGLLCYGSRKHIYATLMLCIYALYKSKGKKKIIGVLFIGLIFIFLFINFYADFTELNEKASSAQGEGEDFIRLISAAYFITDFSYSPLYILWGTGLEISNSKLGILLSRLADNGIYQADVGIIGYYSKFGLLGVSAIFLYIWVFIKHWSKISVWLQGFFLMKLLLIIFDFWAIWDVGMMAYAIFLYFLYIEFRRNRCCIEVNKK